MSLKIDHNTHRLIGVQQVDSPNANDRPKDEISLLVIHNISLPPGQFNTGCVERFFCNQLNKSEHPYFEQIDGIRVSAHLLIERTGRVVQFVPFNKRAWHAGESRFKGRPQCNDFSIGIELEGTDTLPFSAIQYQTLTDITHQLMAQYPDITVDRITGHSDIAPGRKTDPGEYFDWSYFTSELTKRLKDKD